MKSPTSINDLSGNKAITPSEPMMLPWLARKWNVSDARALELWQQACQYAQATAGDDSSSRYWEVAKNRLINLLDKDVIARNMGDEAPWLMIQLNVLRLLFWVYTKSRRFSMPRAAQQAF